MDAHAEPRCPNCFKATSVTPCPACGWRPGAENPPPALPLGTRLDGRYRLGQVLGHGGFGITYLAWDDNLQLRLAIKEYLPRDSATRAPDGLSLAVYSGPAAEQFAYGLERFLDEARALARFDQHPGIVTVKSFFRAHGTGYSVMDYVEGLTLKQYLAQQPGGRLPFDQALRLLQPILDALRAVHKEGLLHRDIAPDNIYLTRSGRVKLLDFGAARFAAGEHSKSLSVILKPGYAPEEQYRTKGKQGPWTDVYSLAATLYRAITGILPPEALDRVEQDELIPPSRLGVAITPEQEAVLLKALAVRAGDRYPSVAALQEAWREAEAPAIQPEVSRKQPKLAPLSLDLQPEVSREPPKHAPLSLDPWIGTESSSPPVLPRSGLSSAVWTIWKFILRTFLIGIVLIAMAGFVMTLLDLPSVQTPSVSENQNTAKDSLSPSIGYRYLDNGDGTVTDTTTGLQWMRCSLGQNWNGSTCFGKAKKLTWDDAMRQPQAFSYAGYSDWRMPTKDELLTLVYCSSGLPKTWNDTGNSCEGNYNTPKIDPKIDQTAFPNTPSWGVWSGSSSLDPAFTWGVNFDYGNTFAAPHDINGYRVRLVRRGQ